MKASYSLALTALLSSPSAFAMQQDESSLMDDILTKLGSSETVDESKLIDWGVLPGPLLTQNKGLVLALPQWGCTRLMTGKRRSLLDRHRYFLWFNLRLLRLGVKQSHLFKK